MIHKIKVRVVVALLIFNTSELKKHNRVSKGITFKDCRGEDVLGWHSPRGQAWCLLAQIDEKEILKESR